ncbi:hypothetical protein [Lapillicoccus sp.]|uniref:hypothetical protein n=1 Tax=Lapillicoccus sp. TaxID=1909287 RepID=UPI0025D5702F|nr:hypothetical protein [Lapillicoccus sp.]
MAALSVPEPLYAAGPLDAAGPQDAAGPLNAAEPAWCTTTPRRSWRALGRPSVGGVKSVASALDVLECFAVDGELGV